MFLGGSYALCFLVKFGFQVIRPWPHLFLHHDATYSFPSGHTFGVTLLSGTLVILTKSSKAVRKHMRTWHFVMIALVGLSRLILGAHWLCDVAGAILLAYMCLASLLWAREYFLIPRISMAVCMHTLATWLIILMYLLARVGNTLVHNNELPKITTSHHQAHNKPIPNLPHLMQRK